LSHDLGTSNLQVLQNDLVTTRNPGLDALKGVMTLLVVFHHTAITYGAIGGWYYKEIPPSQSLQSLLLVFFCAVNQAYFMGLFFLLAGYFTPSALQRKGVAQFLGDRAIRLGIPLLFYGFVLGPVSIALARTASGQDFLETLMGLWTRGTFEQGPMWFAKALLIMSLAVAVVWLWSPASVTGNGSDHGARDQTERSFPSHARLLIAALVCGAVSFLVRLLWPVGVEVFGLQLAYFPGYILLFVAGCWAAKDRAREHIPVETMQTWRRVAWITLPLLAPLGLLADAIPLLRGSPNGGWNVPSFAYALWEPFVAWGAILWLLAWASAEGTGDGKVMHNLARRAFTIYVIHPVILIGVALSWHSVAAPALVKFAVTGTLACAVCYWIAGILVRLPWLRRVL
jgi:fucose 4-O-acetylase-like acetyltransferase